jgi:hypothetical protein
MTNRKPAHTAPLGSLPTAGGGMARAAYSAAIKARLDIDPLLKSSGLTTVQLKNPDTRIAVKNQIKFVNQVACTGGCESSIYFRHKVWGRG